MGQEFTEDDEGEAKQQFRQRRWSTRKSKTGLGMGGSAGRQKLDARQYTMCAGSCFLISWGLAVTILLLRLGLMYTFDTIRWTREQYGVLGAAEWARTRASRDVYQAVEVWNIINGSIAGLIYMSPQDYSNLIAVLSPAFDLMPSLHSVELAYSDRTSEVVITRSKAEGGIVARESSNYMQSDSADCFLMGVNGCINQPEPGQEDTRPEWYNYGSILKTDPYGGAFAWAQEMDVVVEPLPDGGDLLYPAMHLIFQATFPADSPGAGIMAVGRITVKAGALSGNRLVDERLGKDGSVYVADATGAMVASKEPEDVLTVQDGIVRYKTLWELEGKWTSSVKSAFKKDHRGHVSIEAMHADEDSLVVVEPLEEPCDRFAVVVVARSFTAFEQLAMMGTAAFASIVAPAPYVLVGTLAFFFFWIQCFKTMVKNDGKVGLEGGKNRRISITATMAGSTKALGFAQKSDSMKPTMTSKLTRLRSFMGKVSEKDNAKYKAREQHMVQFG
jgi:hypothetical protein